MKRSLRPAGFFLILSLIWTDTLSAEPLRIVVPEFSGPEPISQRVRTAFYFEMVKAFRQTGAAEKGAWILYGKRPIERPTHDAIVDSALLPSLRADLALWGQVYKLQDGAVVQLYLSLTPLLRERDVRPELWTVSLRDKAGKRHSVKLDIPGQFYEFEPLLLREETIQRFSTPEEMPIYSLRSGGEKIGEVGADVMYFLNIFPDASEIATKGIPSGWVRTPPFTRNESEAMAFSEGMVQLLRGDWLGARQKFGDLLARSDLPQGLRVHALLYSGLAREKAGESGRDEFESAYRLNTLDRSAAAYLLMGQLADISRLQAKQKTTLPEVAWKGLRQTIDATRPLFPRDDPWINEIDGLSR